MRVYRTGELEAIPRLKGGEIPITMAKNTEYVPSEPIMYLTTEGGAPIATKTDYVNCHYRLVDEQGTGRILFDTDARIRGRGNTTWDMPKKPYKVKLTNTARMLGLPTSKDWALLANYTDQTRVKNAVAYEMFRRTSQAWTPRSFFCEVVLNGRYDGLYQFIESVAIDVNRNNIVDIKDTDVAGRNLTGGYCWEIEIREAATTGWYTRLGQAFVPDDPDLTIPAQLDYSKTTLQGLEDRLFAENFTDSVAGYRPLIDMDSWIDWYLTTELIGSVDSGWGASIRITKDRDAVDGTVAKIKLGPPWDYDLTFGANGWSPTEWIVRLGAFPIARMLEDPAFVTRMQQRWTTLKAVWTDAPNSITSWASALYTTITPQRERDNDRWARFLSPITDVTNWLNTRIPWLDTQIMTTPDTTPPSAPTGCTVGPLIAGGRTISWTPAGDPAAGADVVGYRVRMNGVIAGIAAFDSNLHMNNFVDIPNTPGGAVFTVAARDRTGNWSTATTAV